MYVRTTRVRKNGRTYEYHQLVETYRRTGDGMPMHRVVANLSRMTAVEVQNLKTALAASRQGKAVVVASVLGGRRVRPAKPAANLRYLDIGVLLELWRECGMAELLDEVLPVGDATEVPSAVVAALTIQRCVDPGSKLYAERWFPRTALPELLGVSPASFNNTRIHRVLDGLDERGCELGAKLPKRYVGMDGAFAAMFLDVTDTWFVGHGPQLAERAKTKEGLVRRKVGIVLLCNELGYPLRWEVIRGRENEGTAMSRMVGELAGLSWVGTTPLVCDRAMGSTAQIKELLAAELRFVTALTSNEFSAYTEAIPHEAVAELFPGCGDDREEAARAAAAVEAAGLKRVDENLYVLDLGIVRRPSDDGGAIDGRCDGEEVDATMEAVRLGRKIRDEVAQGRRSSLAAAGRALGLGKSVTGKYRRLADLSEEIQLAVLEGRAKGVTIAELLRLQKESDLEVQEVEFERLVEKAAGRGSGRGRGSHRQSIAAEGKDDRDDSVCVRAVVYFNPEMFVEQRRRAQRQLEEIEGFVSGLNERLARPRCRMTREKIWAEVNQKLREYDLVNAFKVEIEEQQGVVGNEMSLRVRLSLVAAQWAVRRRYDGFSLLVAHPKLNRSGTELCRLYRAKEQVEKDFGTIKSLVRLRPVRHRVEAKVRAHVTICMLALMLARKLEHALSDKYSAAGAIEQLASCCLNRYTGKRWAAYAVTEVTREQDAILRAVGLRWLADDDAVAERITAR